MSCTLRTRNGDLRACLQPPSNFSLCLDSKSDARKLGRISMPQTGLGYLTSVRLA
jgi:hypothetical protein